MARTFLFSPRSSCGTVSDMVLLELPSIMSGPFIHEIFMEHFLWQASAALASMNSLQYYRHRSLFNWIHRKRLHERVNYNTSYKKPSRVMVCAAKAPLHRHRWVSNRYDISNTKGEYKAACLTVALSLLFRANLQFRHLR